MFAPQYHESANINIVGWTSSLTWATHAFSESMSASEVSMPCSRMYSRKPEIHSTCWSMHTGMLMKTEGLPGPVIMNILGNPAVCTPK